MDENKLPETEENHSEIEKIEGILVLGFVIELGCGLGLSFVSFPKIGPVCPSVNILGLLVMSVLPGLVCSQAFLRRKVDSESPKWDFYQSLAEKSLIFFALGSIPAVWLAFRQNSTIGAGLLASVLIAGILIFIGWFTGNRWRKNLRRRS